MYGGVGIESGDQSLWPRFPPDPPHQIVAADPNKQRCMLHIEQQTLMISHAHSPTPHGPSRRRNTTPPHPCPASQVTGPPRSHPCPASQPSPAPDFLTAGRISPHGQLAGLLSLPASSKTRSPPTDCSCLNTCPHSLAGTQAPTDTGHRADWRPGSLVAPLPPLQDPPGWRHSLQV
jgi:hypothetical protein